MTDSIDWNELWKQGRLDYTWNKRRGYSAEIWNNMWRRADIMQDADNGRSGWIISRLELEPEDTILDIGAGSGALAVPLAKSTGKVTALDISEAALDIIRKKAEKEGLANINYICKKWEDAELETDIEQHDIVIASYSVAMLDLKEALLKMDRAAKRGVYIFEAAGERFWHYRELWPKLHGEEFIPSPDYIYIVNVLYQMGIFADVEIWEHETEQHFSNLDEAVKRWKTNLNIDTPQATGIIREYLQDKFTPDKDGISRKSIQKTVRISWKKKQRPGDR